VDFFLFGLAGFLGHSGDTTLAAKHCGIKQKYLEIAAA
jgi:hypothetical protein